MASVHLLQNNIFCMFKPFSTMFDNFIYFKNQSLQETSIQKTMQFYFNIVENKETTL